MSILKKFEYYLERGIIKKIQSDIQKAEFLIKESETRFNGLNNRLKLMGIDRENANSIIIDCYDILMALIRAKLCIDGYSASGYFAHEAEISYLKKLNFPDEEVYFLDELRRNRNSINYFGKILDEKYAENIAIFAKRIFPELKKMTLR